MPYCPKCGVAVAAEDAFCARCGHAMAAAPLPQQPPPEQPLPEQPPPEQPPPEQPSPEQLSPDTNTAQPPEPAASWPSPEPDAAQPPEPAASWPSPEPGIPRPPDSEAAAGLDTWAPPPLPPARPRRPAVLLMAAVAVLLLGAAAVAAYMLFFPRSPKELFLVAQYRYYQEISSRLQDSGQATLEVARRQAAEASIYRFQLSGGIQGIPELEPYADTIRTSTLVFETHDDPQADRRLVTAAYRLRGSELISGQLYFDPQQLAVSVPALYDKYLVLENNNLTGFFDRLGIPYTGPDRLPTNQDRRTAVELSPEELRELTRAYGQYLLDNLSEEDFTLTRNVSYPAPTGEVKLRQVTLHLPEQKVKDLLKGLVTRFQQDEAALDLVADQMASLGGAMARAGDPLPPWQSDREDLKRQIRDGADEVLAGIDEMRLPGGLRVTLLLDRKGRMVQQDIQFAVEVDREQVDFGITIDTWQGSDRSVDSKAVVRIAPERTAGRDELKLTAQTRRVPGARDQSRTTGTYTVRLRDAGEEVGFELQVESERSRDQATGIVTVTSDFALEVMAPDARSGDFPGRVEGRVTQVEDNRLKNGRYENQTTVQATLPVPGGPTVDVEVALEAAVDFARAPEFPSFTAGNSFDLTHASQAEIEELLWEIQFAAQDFVERNMDLFQ